MSSWSVRASFCKKERRHESSSLSPRRPESSPGRDAPPRFLETAASNTILQTIVDDDKRLRVMSFYAMAFLGVAPLGSLLAGTLAVHLTTPHVVQLAGAMCVVGSAIFAFRLPTLRAFIRPIYRRIGILPDVTSGIPSEAECEVSDDAGR